MYTSVKRITNLGFTMIEVMLVLGISGLLLLITFFGQGSIRTESQFQDSVEGLRVKLERIKDEVSTTVSTDVNGCLGVSASGTKADCILFGKLVVFDLSTSNYYVKDIIANGPARNAPVSSSIPVTNPTIYGPQDNLSLPWGSVFDLNGGGFLKKVIFTRHSGTGELQTYVLNLTGPNTFAGSASTYTANTPGEIYRLPVKGPKCDRADIVFNDPVNTIRVEYEGKSC